MEKGRGDFPLDWERTGQKEEVSGSSGKVFKVEGLLLDDLHRMVMVNQGEVRLTPIEYEILRLLIMERGKVFSSDEIYRKVWNLRPVRVDNTIAVHVRHIREKIEADPARPQYLKAVWGRGYMVG